MSQTVPLMRVLFFVLLFTTSHDAWGQSAHKKREAAYQAKLQSYSDVLKPGMTRKNVEDYLRRQGVAFGQQCCIEEDSAFADLVYIGKEKHPWYCEKHNVFIAFQFAAVEPHKAFAANDSDTLKKITVFHRLDGCL
jgi:hypothetical protein